jgi:26S proteasome non-ATPase regulatory subunit 9
MTAADLKREALSFIQQRDNVQRQIDEQMNMLRSQSCLQDPVHESLVDRDGFPRSDVDVLLVRTARKRLIG